MPQQMTTPRDLFVHELKEALGFEQAILQTLPTLQKQAKDKQLARGFEKHTKQTRGHVNRIQKALRAVGATASPEPCPGISGIQQEHAEFVRERPTQQVLDSFLTGAAARTEHYEIAAYEGLLAQARALGERDAVKLLDQNLKEDKQTLREVEKVSKRLARDGAKQLKEQERSRDGGRTRAAGRTRTTRTRPRTTARTRTTATRRTRRTTR
jgi:ferritin-like metal-binding protein YciE